MGAMQELAGSRGVRRVEGLAAGGSGGSVASLLLRHNPGASPRLDS